MKRRKIYSRFISTAPKVFATNFEFSSRFLFGVNKFSKIFRIFFSFFKPSENCFRFHNETQFDHKSLHLKKFKVYKFAIEVRARRRRKHSSHIKTPSIKSKESKCLSTQRSVFVTLILIYEPVELHIDLSLLLLFNFSGKFFYYF